MTVPIFLHGLASSSRGTKATWFHSRCPQMLIPDFAGSLPERMDRLRSLLAAGKEYLLIGSSYGGLMAAVHAIEHPEQVSRVILLAPALNFPEFIPYQGRHTDVPALVYLGRRDAVTPPAVVQPLAEQTFTRLECRTMDDDHMLHRVFYEIPWDMLIPKG